MTMAKSRKIPIALKWIFSVYMLILIPFYWINYGLENFLWLSDIVLFFIFFAILFESKLLASMAMVGDFFYTALWNIDFFFTLFSLPSFGFTKYMFSPEQPIWLRALSLFHVALPPLMLFLIYRLGYDKRACRLQIAFSFALIFITFITTSPDKNINLVNGYKEIEWLSMNPFLYLIILSAINCAVIILTHTAVKFWMNFQQRRQQ